MEYPVLPSDIVKINEQLARNFGIDTESTKPIWRLVWSNDQFENRLSDTTLEGLVLITPQVMLRPKYNYIKNRWILERLVVVPDFQQKELGDIKVSYEPIWVFEAHGEAVQPIYRACKFVIDTVYAAMGKSSLAKYKDPEKTGSIEEQIAAKDKVIDGLVEELFGDESSLLGRTVTGEAVVLSDMSMKEK